MSMDIFLLRSWTHYEPKQPKGAPGLRSAGFKPLKGMSAVMLHLGNVPVDQDVTDDWLRERLLSVGLRQHKEDAEPEPAERRAQG